MSADGFTMGTPVESLRRTVETERAGLDALLACLEARGASSLGDAFAQAVALIDGASGRLVVTGVGKSGHVARKITATLSSTGTPSQFIHPAEASHGDLGAITVGDVILALSWSGESAELSDIVAYAKRFGVALIAVTSRAESTLGQAATICLLLPQVAEACPHGLAPTSSTTLQLVLGDALAVCLLERRGFSASDFRRFHPGGKLGASLKHATDMMHGGDAMPLVPDTATLAQAIVEMTGKRFGITGVVDPRGCLRGVLTDGDLRRAFEQGFVDRPVASAMSRSPFTVRPQVLAAEVLAAMNERRITSVFVVEDGRPVGLVHVHDLLQAGVA